MIKIVKGNILNASENIIVHQCNALGTMGAGLAKQIKSKYPVAYEEYYKLCASMKNSRLLLGETQIVHVEKSKYVANIIGQLYVGRDKTVRYTNYDALREGLVKVKVRAKEEGLSVAIPEKIGCGLANGSWDVVYRMIEDVFEDYEVTLYSFG